MAAIARDLTGLGAGAYFIYLGITDEHDLRLIFVAAGIWAVGHSAWDLWKRTRPLR